MGGSWDGNQNKIIPDIYQRYTSDTSTSLTISSRGVVAYPVSLSWGPTGAVQTYDVGDDLTPYTGYPITDPSNAWAVEMFKGTDRSPAPKKVLLYRLTGTSDKQATATISPLTATALYPGTRGNDITIVITELTEPESTFTVSTVVDGTIVDQQTAATADTLVANSWVTFSGTGALAANAGTALTGGVNGTVGAADYASFLQAIKPYQFDVLLYDGTDPTTQQAMQTFINSYFDNTGNQAQLVASGLTNPNSRWVINVNTGVTLSDGTQLTPAQVCWWMAGAQAGAPYNIGLTGAQYPGAVEVSPKLTKSQLEAAISGGQMVLTAQTNYATGINAVTIAADYNSLTTYTKDISEPYHLNRTMRVVMTSGNDINTQFALYYKGLEDNTDQGRMNLKSALVKYLNEMQANRGIQDFDGETDVTVLPGQAKNAVLVNATLFAVGSTDFIYVTWSIN